MLYAAFFRNLNLGRPNSPSKSQFETAFMQAGSASAASFRTNGSLVFAARSPSDAQAILRRACRLMQTSCNLNEPACLRSIEHLASLVAADPFAAIDRATVYERCTTFLIQPPATAPALPLRSRNGNVEVIRWIGGEVFSVSRKITTSPGSPNAFLEKLLGSPATTRNWSTVTRIVEKYA